MLDEQGLGRGSRGMMLSLLLDQYSCTYAPCNEGGARLTVKTGCKILVGR